MDKYLTVTKLNFYIKNLIENDTKLANIVVKGEVSNLNKHYTGHYYFTLKDDNSKISCMMFSSYVNKIKTPINNGDEVLIYGYLSLYEKNGSYQLYCRSIEPFGLGQYLIQLEALKKKLKEEGLFDRQRKMIPQYPSKIALITSKSGAAIKDMIHTIQSRFNPEIFVFPCLVQGEGAPESILNAFLLADDMGFDTIIIGRGGGANEDLKAFNDETLVRAIASSKTPVISAVGHQIDTTLIDYVSDLAAITPTDAGEKATPDKRKLLLLLEGNRNYLNQLMNSKIDKKKQELLQIMSSKYFISPKDYLIESRKRVEQLMRQGSLIIKTRLDNSKINIEQSSFNLSYSINKIIDFKTIQLDKLINRLKGLNPSNIIDKGYSLVLDQCGKVLSSIEEYQIDQPIYIQLKDGRIKAIVKEKEN